MKQIRLIAAAAIFAALTVLTANAQQPATRPATPAPGAASNASGNAGGIEGKIAIINTDFFGDEKTGITRLVNAMRGVDNEFTPRRNELQGLRKRYDDLVAEIQKLQSAPVDPAAARKKADEAETLKTDLERKGQDAQTAYQKRMNEVLAPLYEDIGKSLEAFAKQRGIAIILDASKLGNALFQIGTGGDITTAFITEYNRTRPATAAAATPGK